LLCKFPFEAAAVPKNVNKFVVQNNVRHRLCCCIGKAENPTTWDPTKSPADFDVIDLPHHQSHRPRGATGTANKQQLRKQTVYH
jgi:hypothetical protein